MLTRAGPKLLDFGLAKGQVAGPTGPPATAASSFDDRTLTAEGTLIGTFQYMAPEQLEGRPADPRTDIFAFGMLLYEMATGRKAFDGDSQASLIASILTSQPPPISSARPAKQDEAVPAALDHIVERCLAKNPADRWQTARDVRLELDWCIKGSTGLSPTPLPVSKPGGYRVREALAWMLAAAAIAASATLGFQNLWKPEPETTRFTIPPPSGAIIGRVQNRPRLAISPDGRHLAFQAAKDGRVQIWVRSLGSLDAAPSRGDRRRNTRPSGHRTVGSSRFFPPLPASSSGSKSQVDLPGRFAQR